MQLDYFTFLVNIYASVFSVLYLFAKFTVCAYVESLTMYAVSLSQIMKSRGAETGRLQ